MAETMQKQLADELLTLPLTRQERAWLQERLSDLSAKECYQLSAVLLRDDPQDGVDAVNCILKMHGCRVCLDVGSYSALGAYTLKYEEYVPADVRPYVDLEQLGRRFEDAHPGVYIGNNYVCYPTGESPQYHKGEPLPAQDLDWCAKLKIASAGCPEGVWLRLPDYCDVNDEGPDEIAIALHELGVQKIQECKLLEVKCILPNIEFLMDGYSDLDDLICDANDLGFVLDEQGQGMPDFMARFTAAMELEDCTELKHALDIARNLHCYDYVPVSGIEDYARSELEKMNFYPCCSAPLADQCIDYREYGKDLLDRQGYIFTVTEDGYIRRNGQEFQYERTQPPPQTQGMTMQ